MMPFRYGNSWERFPIETGEIWVEPQTGSLVSICDILDSLPDYMLPADMVYCDPPWNLGNANGYYTKADRTARLGGFNEFSEAFFRCIRLIAPHVCYVEIGQQNEHLFRSNMTALFPVVQEWPITYYRKHPCFLIRGGTDKQSFDFSGMDEAIIPLAAIEAEDPSIIADPCTGQGLTAIAAYRCGKHFLGTELNKRRLAVAIERVNKLGGRYEKSPIS